MKSNKKSYTKSNKKSNKKSNTKSNKKSNKKSNTKSNTKRKTYKKKCGGSRANTPLPIEVALDLAFENATREIQLHNNISFDDALEGMLDIISIQYGIPLYEVKRLSVMREEEHKLEAGFRWNEETGSWMRISNPNDNLLFIAAAGGNEFLLRSEIEKGSDINETNDYNETPLMIAIQNNHTAIVNILLDNYADTVGAIELASQPNVDSQIRSRISRAHSPVNMITGQNTYRNEREARRRSNH
jgi:hypothetical protein